MDTVLTKEFSEDGVVLSGGQYQKIRGCQSLWETMSCKDIR